MYSEGIWSIDLTNLTSCASTFECGFEGLMCSQYSYTVIKINLFWYWAMYILFKACITTFIKNEKSIKKCDVTCNLIPNIYLLKEWKKTELQSMYLEF